jgi:hypothetical protein
MNRISLVLLVAGFAAAGLLYAFARPPATDAFGDDPLNEKRYRRQLRMIGGQANQLSADFIDWFGELWHGENLAYTVAVLTVLATGGFRFVAVRLPPPASGSPTPKPPAQDPSAFS